MFIFTRSALLFRRRPDDHDEIQFRWLPSLCVSLSQNVSEELVRAKRQSKRLDVAVEMHNKGKQMQQSISREMKVFKVSFNSAPCTAIPSCLSRQLLLTCQL